MSKASLKCDCLVVGAGPSGSLLASILARWGRDVILLHNRNPREGNPEETLVPGVRPLLERQGLLGLFEREEFRGTRRHGVIWGSHELAWREQSEVARGFKVAREVLDPELQKHAAVSGARVVVGEAQRGRIACAEAGGTHVEDEEGQALIIEALVVAMATGKSTGPGLLPVREERRLPETVAIWAVVDQGSGFADATIIEAVPEGWWWWLPVSGGRICLTLFVDTEEVKSKGRAAHWNSALAHAVGPAGGHSGLSERGTVGTSRLQHADLPGVLLVGDAATSIDPLSSQGLEKAFASAEEAAHVANTVIERREEADHLVAHQQAWERGLFALHARRTLSFYTTETRFRDEPFWIQRSTTETVAPAPSRLPSSLHPSTDLIVGTAYRRHHRLLETTRGYRIGPDGESHHHVGAVPIAAIMDLLAEESATETLLQKAGTHPDLFPLSRGKVKAALLELLRLGFVD